MATKLGRPTKRKPVETIMALGDAREAGKTLREAAAAAGVHVSTVCRWMARDPNLRRLLQGAARRADLLRVSQLPQRRPSVDWDHACPRCGSKVVVRTADGFLHFWRCERWPRCRFASWRPPAPGRCPTCHGGPLFWTHSRLHTRCDSCGALHKLAS